MRSRGSGHAATIGVIEMSPMQSPGMRRRENRSGRAEPGRQTLGTNSRNARRDHLLPAAGRNLSKHSLALAESVGTD